MGYLQNTLECLFTPDVGLSDEAISRALERIIANPDVREREGLKAELLAMYSDPDSDWIALLENDRYEVYPANDQADARSYVTKRLWNVFFPERKDAPPHTG